MIIRPRWRKVLRDLWLNRNRTLVVVLSIAVGVFAVGVIASSQVMLSRDLQAIYMATNPAQATIYTLNYFDEDLVEAVSGMRDIKEAEGRRRASLRVKTGPNEWRLFWLMAIPDFHEVRIDKFYPQEGAWPPGDREILLERAGLDLAGGNLGDTITVKTADGKEKELRITGTAHDLNGQMFALDGSLYGFTTPATLDWLGEPRGHNEMRIVSADTSRAGDRAYIQAVTNKVRDKIEAAGGQVLFTLIPTPGEPPLNFLIQAIAVIMGALGIMSLLLSGFLVINTISALLTQQTRQIGMMKAVGARRGQVMSLYLVMVVIFGLLALLIAIPLGVAGSYYFSRLIASYLNFDLTELRLPLDVLLMEIAVGLLIPLLAALFPIIMGVRVTVREAISTYGLGKGQFGTTGFDRLLVTFQQAGWTRSWLARPMLISLRNTFRRKGRLALTLVTLIMAGAIFIAVFSVRASLIGTLDDWLAYFQYDIEIQLNRDYRAERVIRETMNVPGVIAAETWGFYNGRRLRPDGTDSDNIMIFAPDADTKLVKPTIVEGRWLRPGDTNALVVSTLMLRDEPDVKVGSEITLKIDGRESEWQVVGISSGGMMMSMAFANYPHFAQVARDVGKAQWVFVVTQEHSSAYQTQISRALEDHFERIGLGVGMISGVAEERQQAVDMFEVIVVLLLIMAVLLAVIGGLGLMGTMSINVIERTREIGVMRAIGASNEAVRWVFIVEGVLIGMLSWSAAIVVAYPISYGLSSAVGYQFLSTPLNHTFSLEGIVIWLVVVIVLAAIASFLPAWNASRLTVREVLAYE